MEWVCPPTRVRVEMDFTSTGKSNIRAALTGIFSTGIFSTGIFSTAILSSGLLVACGGGGGDAGGTPQPGALVGITASNQDAVGRAAATAARTFFGTEDGVATGSGASTSPASVLSAAPANAGRSSHSISALVRRAAQALADPSEGRRQRLAAGASNVSARPLAIAPQTIPCSLSGSHTISFVDADNNGVLSAGDTMTTTSTQCRDTPAVSFSGSSAITFVRYETINGLSSFAGTFLIQQTTIVEGARTSVLNGSMAITFANLSFTESKFVSTVGASGLVISVSGVGIADTVTFEPGFVVDETDTSSNTSGRSNVTSIRGGFSATSIGGRVMLETPSPLLQRSSEAYPYAGTLRVVGNGSALRLVMLDAASVRVELDAALDGIYESSKVLTWAALLPS